jgi:hypothetical protein
MLTRRLQVVFDHVEMRYRPGLPLVLKGLSVRIPAASKCGVVGRTGQQRLFSTHVHLLVSASARLPGAHVSLWSCKPVRSGTCANRVSPASNLIHNRRLP